MIAHTSNGDIPIYEAGNAGVSGLELASIDILNA